jgi:hypothetical protein
VRPPEPGCSTLPALDLLKKVLREREPKLPEPPVVEK